MPNLTEIFEQTITRPAAVKAEHEDVNNLQVATIGETAVQLYRTEPNDTCMRIFDTNTSENQTNWVKVLIHNLQRRNTTLVKCTDKFNHLSDLIQFATQPIYLPFPDLVSEVDKMRDDPTYNNTKLKFQPPKNQSTTTAINYVDNYVSHKFFLFDRVRVKRSKSTFGEFLSISLTNSNIHNVFAYLSNRYLKNEGILSSSSLVNLPTTPVEREVFVRRFFLVPEDRNPIMYATNDIMQIVNVKPYTLDVFDAQFAFIPPYNRSNEVEMVMGAVIEGFKKSKNETKMESMDSEGMLYKEYSVAIKPMVFFNIR
jgi:hypothetical protein